jgi:hypothetical protein
MVAPDGAQTRTSASGRDRTTAVLLWCGVVAGPLFVVAFLIEGATSPGYDPIRLPVSLLSVGAGGWRQIANFLVDGVLLFAFAAGMHRALADRRTPSRLGPLLLGIFAVGVIGAGVFSTDPAAGYPPRTPIGGEPSLHSTLHDVVSLVVFVTLPVACLVFARDFAAWSDPAWARYSLVTGVVLAIVLVIMIAGFSGTSGFDRFAGAIQRAWIIVGWGWVALVAVHMLRTRTPVDARDARA